MDLFPFIPGYTQHIYAEGSQPAFVMLAGFIVTFVCARGYTRIARRTGWGSASFGGVHAHHLVFGLVLAFLAAAVEFASRGTYWWFELLLAAAFGSGAALVLDEFALIFHLKDVYWEREGRKSIDAVILGLMFGILFLMHVTPLGGGDDAGWVRVATICVNLVFVLIAAGKGKLFLACFGVFIPALALIGALRLAEPTSIWAHRFYHDDGHKRHRSIRRYAEYDAVWRPRKEKLWDILGGRTGRPLRTKLHDKK